MASSAPAPDDDGRPSMLSVQSAFDFNALEPSVRNEVKDATARLRSLQKRTGEQIIEIGRELIGIRNLLSRGQFLSWIDAEFSWGKTNAYNFISVAETFPELPESGNLGPSVLIQLAAKSTPEDVRVEFTGLAAIGEQVSLKQVREAIAERKAPRRAEPIPVNDWNNDDEPEEVPYEIVDMRTGELSPPMSRNHSTSFMPSPPPPSTHIPTTQQQATRIAAELLERHGAGLAIQIADAIYAQCGASRGAA